MVVADVVVIVNVIANIQSHLFGYCVDECGRR